MIKISITYPAMQEVVFWRLQLLSFSCARRDLYFLKSKNNEKNNLHIRQR